jgi:hypothetical protein
MATRFDGAGVDFDVWVAHAVMHGSDSMETAVSIGAESRAASFFRMKGSVMQFLWRKIGACKFRHAVIAL